MSSSTPIHLSIYVSVKVLDFKKQNLLKSLRVLVVCYDNLSAERKSKLITASELVKNREWLVKVRGRVHMNYRTT